MTSSAAPSPWLVPAPPARDAVAEAEAMANTHLARTDEVERVGKVVRWLDDLVRVPGTKFGIGLDAIAGFFLPGVGDAITGTLGLTVISAAVRRGVPTVVIARMVLNLVIDLVVGLVPILGDTFDLFWRSNTRNFALLERHQGELEPKARAADYALVGIAAVSVVSAVVTPFVLLYLLAGAIF